MKADRDFSPITPQETRDLAFDFRYDRFPLDPAEYLVSAEFTLEVASTEGGATADANPNSRKDGAATISANLDGDAALAAVQRVTGCQAGTIYRVICRATTSRGQILELYALMPCRLAA